MFILLKVAKAGLSGMEKLGQYEALSQLWDPLTGKYT